MHRYQHFFNEATRFGFLFIYLFIYLFYSTKSIKYKYKKVVRIQVALFNTEDLSFIIQHRKLTRMWAGRC